MCADSTDGFSQAFRELGGRFTLSDDSHGVEHVGLNFDKMLQCIRDAGITELFHLAPAESLNSLDSRFTDVRWASVSLTDLESHKFWRC